MITTWSEPNSLTIVFAKRLLPEADAPEMPMIIALFLFTDVSPKSFHQHLLIKHKWRHGCRDWN